MGSMLVAMALSMHMRLQTPNGPVHVLIPQTPPEVTVVYVHGFWTDVDGAWVQHRLEAQLQASGVNAAFIVPEAPSGPGEKVRWPELGALLTTVEAVVGQALPERVVAVGHSGAYRTLQG